MRIVVNQKRIILVILFFMIFSCLGTVSAIEFNPIDNSKDVQDFINDDSTQDNIIYLGTGNYYFEELNITRNLTIQSKNDNDIVNIIGDGTSTLFNVKSESFTIKNLNIISFGVAINSSADTELYIDGVTLNSLTIPINSIVTHTIINSNIVSLDINDNSLGASIYLNNNNISRLTFNFNSNQPTVHIINNTISSGVSMSFTGEVNCNNFVFKNNIITGITGIELTGSTTSKILNLNISNNIINVTGNGVSIIYSILENLTINNNIINSGSNSIYFQCLNAANSGVYWSNILIKDNFMNALANGIYYTGGSTNRGASISNHTIENNTILANQNGIIINLAPSIVGFNILSNDIKAGTFGIDLRTAASSGATPIANIIVNYNSIVANEDLFFLTERGLVSGTIVNIDFNWWGSNILNSSKIYNFAAMNNYYIVTLDRNGANDIGDFVIANVVLDDGSPVDNRLPDFYVIVDNNHILESIFAKGGMIEVRSPGNPYSINISDAKVEIFIAGKASTLVESIDVYGVPNEELTITATLKNYNTALIDGKNLRFLINGVYITSAITDINGVATIKYTPLTEGTFSIRVEFEEDADYIGSSNETSLFVKNRESTSIETNIQDITIYELDNIITITATLKNSNGVGIGNKIISFKIDGVTYSNTTNSNGLAILHFKPGRIGTFPIEIDFIDDGLDYASFNVISAFDVSFVDVQKMIDDTPDGGTLELLGEYNDVALIINKSITIIGGKITSSLAKPIFTITGSNVNISGFDLSNTHPDGIIFEIKDGATNVTISNNKIKNARYGILMHNAYHINVLDNNFTGCFEGIALEGNLDYITIEGNILTGNGPASPWTTGRRIDGTGSGIVINSTIPNLVIRFNIINESTHGIYLDDGLKDTAVDLYDMIYFNIISGNHRDLDASSIIRGLTDDLLATGPNWYGGQSVLVVCPRLYDSATQIFADVISIDDYGTFEVYFWYIDRNGSRVNVTKLPPISITINHKNQRQTLLTDDDARVRFFIDSLSETGDDFFDFTFSNQNIYWVNLNIPFNLTEDQKSAAKPAGNGSDNSSGSGTNNTSNNNNLTNLNTNTNTNSNTTPNSDTNTNSGTNTRSGMSSYYPSGSGVGTSSGSGEGTGSGSGIATGSGSGLGSNTGEILNTNDGQGYQGSQIAQAGISNPTPASAAMEEDGDSSENNPDAYEITPKDPTQNTDSNALLISVIVIFCVLILLGIGIKGGLLSTLFKK
ncbi:MAG: right-handed parallel beta-helix repeat-containing protein [Methanobrevibacter sp.]|nr:right-handed parallel beta-helix repeat-containing protein [Methanobrevibacter sp.]